MKIKTLTECEKQMNELQRIESSIASRTAAANTEIAKVRDAAVDEIGEYEAKALEIRNAINVFAETNRENEEIFVPGKKSLNLAAGTIGFSDNPEKIIQRSGFSVAKSIELAKKEGFEDLVKTGKESIDKEAIKKKLEDGELDTKKLAKLGMTREQTESFYITLKTIDKI